MADDWNNVFNALLGRQQSTDEAIKGYRHYLLGGGKPYTEAQLSDQAYRDMLYTSYNALNTGQGIDYGDYPVQEPHYREHMTDTDLGELIGRTAPRGVRRVSIDGHPYIQVRDLYDFKYDQDAEHDPLSMLQTLFRYPRHGMEQIGVSAGQHVGKPYPVNMLLPENPGSVARPTALDAFRAKTNYPTSAR